MFVETSSLERLTAMTMSVSQREADEVQELGPDVVLSDGPALSSESDKLTPRSWMLAVPCAGFLTGMGDSSLVELCWFSKSCLELTVIVRKMLGDFGNQPKSMLPLATLRCPDLTLGDLTGEVRVGEE